MSTESGSQFILNLIGTLNHPNSKQRLDAIRALKHEITIGNLEREISDSGINCHIHTIYSFSPYSPSMAVFLAWQAGLATAGIMDHDSVGGVREFIEAGNIIGIPTTIGCEIRADFTNTSLAGKCINNPDQKSIAYLALHGIPHSKIDVVEKFLEPIKTARSLRNKLMTQQLAALLAPFGIRLDYESDVLPISMIHEGGSVTERHLLMAAANKIIETFGKGKPLVTFLAKELNIHIPDKIFAFLNDNQNQSINYDVVNLLKQNIVERFYVPATEECPSIQDVVQFANENAIILAYPYLGDIIVSKTHDKKAQQFEDIYLDELFNQLDGFGIKAVTYMPSRNTKEQIRRIQKLCKEHSFLQISGEDINQPRQPFVSFSKDSENSILFDNAWALIGHELNATRDLRLGFFSQLSIKRYPILNERINYFSDFAMKKHVFKVLAFDLGASSGRSIIGHFDGEHIKLQEIHRFSNDPVTVNGTIYWDILRLIFEIKQGLILSKNVGVCDSVGIDTWGVDFGLLDNSGRLLENPVHYRDSRTNQIMEKVFKLMSRENIYSITGTQFMPLNTLYQLYSLYTYRPDLFSRVSKILFTPDLLAYALTGELKTEYTIASTSQMVEARNRIFSSDMLSLLEMNEDIFPPLCEPGKVIELLSEDLCNELDLKPMPFIRVASHDTASAIVAIPTTKEDFVFISSGTWSLVGIESDEPIINEQTLKMNFTNEGGYKKKNLFMKNIMGLWLIQESRRQWIREGNQISFMEMEHLAMECEPFKCFINPDDSMFLAPGDMPARIRNFCRQTNQFVPDTFGEIIRCIYESLALTYRDTISQIETIMNKTVSEIIIVGGGTKDNVLSQFTANATGKNVMIGPVEATALGNIAVQLITLGAVDSLTEARRVISRSFESKQFDPRDVHLWEGAYVQFNKIRNIFS